MNRKTISGHQATDKHGSSTPFSKKLPYQKPLLVEIDLSGDSHGGKTPNGFEVTLTSVGITAGPS